MYAMAQRNVNNPEWWDVVINSETITICTSAETAARFIAHWMRYSSFAVTYIVSFGGTMWHLSTPRPHHDHYLVHQSWEVN